MHSDENVRTLQQLFNITVLQMTLYNIYKHICVGHQGREPVESYIKYK